MFIYTVTKFGTHDAAYAEVKISLPMEFKSRFGSDAFYALITEHGRNLLGDDSESGISGDAVYFSVLQSDAPDWIMKLGEWSDKVYDYGCED